MPERRHSGTRTRARSHEPNLLQRIRREATRRSPAAARAADGLALSASPTFAVMALLTTLGGSDSAEMLCSAHASPLSGMVTMYLLMSAFHAAPWLKLIRDYPRLV